MSTKINETNYGNLTLEEFKKDKEDLEKKLYDLFLEFNSKYDVPINNIELLYENSYSSIPYLYAVELRVIL